MAENKWIVDGHHFTCPDCKKTMAIVVNESDEDFEFCPFCGKRMSGQMAENKMAEVAQLFGKKLGEEFWIQGFCGVYKVKFTEGGILYLDTGEPNYRWRLHNIDPLLIGNAEILSSDDWRVKQTLKDLAGR